MKNYFTMLLICSLLGACSNQKGEGLAPSSGPSGFMYLIMDSIQWKGPLGKTLDSLLRQEMIGLPRKEPIFHMRWIDPRKLNFVLKQGRNLIYAVSLDQNHTGANIIKSSFTKESVEAIRKDTSFYISTNKNVFAKNQEVMYLFATTEKDLIQKVRHNGKKIVSFFNRTEIERLNGSLFKSGQMTGITQILRNKYKSEIKIPFGYQLVMDTTDFLWVRQTNQKDDRYVFVARTPYVSRTQFHKDSLIQFRNNICRKFIYGNPEKPDTYTITEVENRPVESREIKFNNHYSVEMRGLWATHSHSMGGPFISYALADESTGYLYYIEGFTYCPSRDQREIMRELETILMSFKTSKEITLAKQ